MRIRFLTLIAASALAFAQDGPDPSGRAARLSFLTGSVSFQPGSVEDWVPAELNRPLTTGDRLWTEAGARAELNVGSLAVRLNGRTNFSFINLDDRTAQIQISMGSLSVRVRRLADDETVEIDTPQVALSLLRPGEYRVDVNDQGDTTVATVRGGEAEANAGGQTFDIRPREQVRIVGVDGSQSTFDKRDAPPTDAFENWCADRDRREDMSQSARYVSRDMPGYADLDGNGTWRQDPQYGAVWVPGGVPVGWAPYHYGHWAWISPWGWTWVDDAPWGYAPFHYGRWVSVGGGWGWIPGPMAVRPVYAPAMVAWVGGAGFGVGLSVGGPAIGWFPLGFGEVWVPSYHASPAYFNRVNVSNTVVNNVTVTNVYNTTVVNRTTTVTNVRYVNQNVPGAVTVVSHDAMIGGRPVAQAAVRVPAGAMSSAQVQTLAPVAPQRQAVLGGRTTVSAAPPAAAMNRTVITRTPPPPAPVPFARQQTALQANPGRPLDRGTVSNLQTATPPPARPMYRQVTPAPNAARPANATPLPPNRPSSTPSNPPAPAANPERPVNAPPRAFDRPATPPAPRPQAAPTPAPRPPTPTPANVERPATTPPPAPARPVTPTPPPAAPPRTLTPERTTPPPAQKTVEQKQKPKPKSKEEKEKEKKQ